MLQLNCFNFFWHSNYIFVKTLPVQKKLYNFREILTKHDFCIFLWGIHKSFGHMRRGGVSQMTTLLHQHCLNSKSEHRRRGRGSNILKICSRGLWMASNETLGMWMPELYCYEVSTKSFLFNFFCCHPWFIEVTKK